MSILPTEKRCPACQRTLPTSEFYTSKKTPGKLGSYCKSCTKELALAWQRANPDKVKASAKVYREKRPYGSWSETKKGQSLEARKAYYARNKELTKTRAQKSKSEAKAADPIRYRARTAIHNNRCRSKRYGVLSDFGIADWDKLMTEFNRSCAWCKAPAAILDMDHIQPMVLGGADVVGNLVPVCRPCNAHKGHMPPEEFATLMSVDLVDLRRRARVREPKTPPDHPIITEALSSSARG